MAEKSKKIWCGTSSCERFFFRKLNLHFSNQIVSVYEILSCLVCYHKVCIDILGRLQNHAVGSLRFHPLLLLSLLMSYWYDFSTKLFFNSCHLWHNFESTVNPQWIKVFSNRTWALSTKISPKLLPLKAKPFLISDINITHVFDSLIFWLGFIPISLSIDWQLILTFCQAIFHDSHMKNF